MLHFSLDPIIAEWFLKFRVPTVKSTSTEEALLIRDLHRHEELVYFDPIILGAHCAQRSNMLKG